MAVEVLDNKDLKDFYKKFSISKIFIIIFCLLLIVVGIWIKQPLLILPVLALIGAILFGKPEYFLFGLFVTLVFEEVYFHPSDLTFTVGPTGTGWTTAVAASKTRSIAISDIFGYLSIPLFCIWVGVFKRFKVKWQTIWSPLILLVLFYIIPFIFIKNPSLDTIRGMFYWIITIIITYIISQMLLDSKDLCGFLKTIFKWNTIMAFGSVFFILVLIGVFFRDILAVPWKIRVLAKFLFIEPNFYANLLCITAFWTWSLIHIDKRSSMQKWYWISLLIQGIGILLTFSRGALMAFVLAPFVFMIFYQRNIFYNIKIKAIMILSFIFFIIIGSAVIFLKFDDFNLVYNYLIRDRVTEVKKDESASVRPRFWKMGLYMANDNPLGVGPRQFSNKGRQYKEILNLGKSSSHSTYIEPLSEAGFMGFLSWMVFVFLILYLSWKKLEILSKESTHYWLLSGSILGFITILIQGIFFNLLEYAHVWFSISVLIALIYYPKKEEGFQFS